MEYFGGEKDNMEAEDWKKMYLILMRGICDVLEDEPHRSVKEIMDVLVAASQQADDYYINIDDAVMGRPERKQKLWEIDDFGS